MLSLYKRPGFSTDRAFAHAVPPAVKAAGCFLHAPPQSLRLQHPSVSHSANTHWAPREPLPSVSSRNPNPNPNLRPLSLASELPPPPAQVLSLPFSARKYSGPGLVFLSTPACFLCPRDRSQNGKKQMWVENGGLPASLGSAGTPPAIL